MSDVSEVYDPVDLRERIVLCFTIGELRELAEQLGVGGSIAWQRGIHEAARSMVQQCERYAGLPALVAKLRAARPDMDWPTASPPPVAPAPAAAVPVAPVPAPAAEALVSAPVAPAHDPAAPPAPTIADPFAPLPVSPTTEGAPIFAPRPPLSGPGSLSPSGTTPASFASPPIATVMSPAPVPAASPYWPGTTPAPAPQPSRGVDARILIAVASLMLVAAIIAYLAGRASNAPTASPAGSASPSRRGDGPAALAADAIDRRLANLARVCELPPGVDVGELVFARVFERCGPPAPPRPRSPLPSIFDVDAGAGAPEPPPEPVAPAAPAARPRRGGRTAADAPAEAVPAPGRGCEGACDAEHRSCKQRCGPEPTESGGYEGWQKCLSRCLSNASHCRLTCR